MKQEDFERLKKLCQENDFEIDGVMNDEGVYFIRKKDPWDGVEFFLGADGIIRKIPDEETLNILKKVKLLDATPSNEQAYVDQLKKECFERFGEIKEGDRFDITGNRYTVIKGIRIGYEYDKASDRLFYVVSPSIETYLKDPSRVVLYQSGKWATRVKDRVEVEYGHYSLPFDPKYILALHFSIDDPNRMNDEAGKFLAKQLEEYLNKE